MLQHSSSNTSKRSGVADASVAAAVAAGRELVARAEAAGYGELVASVSPIAFADPATLGHVRGALSEPLATLSDLLWFGVDVPRDALERTLGSDLVAASLHAALLRKVGADAVATTGLQLTRVLGLWYLHQTPTASPMLYFGEDSVALAWHLPRLPRGRVLDLCCGPGFQLLSAIRHGAHGIGVEINPFAANMARINLGINGLDDRAEIRRGDLYEPLADESGWDLVVANPPFLPCPDEVPYAFVGAGGTDGMAVTWRILEGLPQMLAANGVAHVVGAALSDGVRLVIEDRLAQWAATNGFDVLVTVTSAFAMGEGTPALERFSGIALVSDEAGRAASRAHFLELLRRERATQLCGFFLRVRAGTGTVTVLDVAPRHAANMFFA